MPPPFFIMIKAKLKDVVAHTKLTQCASCDSHEYILPFPITPDIQHYINFLGPLKFPLERVKVIKIENEFIQLSGRVGQNTIRIKFKKQPQQREMFEMQLAAYIGKETQSVIETAGLL